MDRARPGRRRASSEIVTEGKRKKSSPADLQKITKLLTVKSEDVLAQSPLSKLRGSECWWTRSLRNKVICLDHKKPKAARGCPPKGLPKRTPRVILTDIRQTELGRKYLKIPPVTEASLSDTANLKSEQLSSSSDGSLESCQSVNHHKSFLSERLTSKKGKKSTTATGQTETDQPSPGPACTNKAAFVI